MSEDSDLIEKLVGLLSHPTMKDKLGSNGAIPFARVQYWPESNRSYHWVDANKSLDEQAQAMRELCIEKGYYGFELRAATIGSGQEGGQLTRDFEIVDIGWMK